MRAASARFLAAVRYPHDLASRVDLLFAGEVVVEGLAVDDGAVTLDRTAGTLGRLNMELIEPARLPLGAGSQLTPFGYELAPWRGIRYPDGTTELLPLGVFPIQSSAVDGVTLRTSISAMDRSQRVREAGFEDDYQIGSGTNYATAIQALIDSRVPGLTYAFTSTTFTTPLLTFTADMDPWEEAQKMARDIGCELYFDGLGRCVLRPEPDLTTAVPLFTISEGEGGVLIGASLELDRAPAYNRVIAYGSNADLGFVPRGVATDNDPASPTYYDGPFGRKPRRYASPFLATDAQAESAARAILVSNLGVARSISFAAVPNPAIEPGDPILLVRAALGLNEVHIPDIITVGLGPEGEMTGSTRSRQESA